MPVISQKNYLGVLKDKNAKYFHTQLSLPFLLISQAEAVTAAALVTIFYV